MPRTSRAGLALIVFLQCFDPRPFARASVFITHPYEGITCSGGSECTVTWADDGLTPLLASVGLSDLALFQGTNTLVQQLAAGLDVSQTRELTFVPNSKAGPNANSYWIKLTSLSARSPNDTSKPYTSFSGQFALDNMSGAEGSPVASLTSSLPSSAEAGSQTQTHPSSSVTNGVIGTTTLPEVIPTGSASTLSSALSAISSAASGSSGLLLTTSSTRTGSGSGTSSAVTGTSSSSSSGSIYYNSLRTSYSRLGASLVLVFVTVKISAGLS